MGQYSENLEKTFERALKAATARKHEFVRPEELLLALLDDPDALSVFQGCDVDVAEVKQEVEKLLQNPEDIVERKKPVGFNGPSRRIAQRALVRGEGVGKETVNGADLLLSIFAETHSLPVTILIERGISHFDAVNFIVHGITKNMSEEMKAFDALSDCLYDALPEDAKVGLTQTMVRAALGTPAFKEKLVKLAKTEIAAQRHDKI